MTARTPGRLPAAQPKPVGRRHGKHGYVRIIVDVPPETRERLVELAWERRTSLSEQIRAACEAHLEAA